MDQDTIAAIATAPGRSAIAVIRMSGREAFKILARLLHPDDLKNLEPGRARLVRLFATGNTRGEWIDECIVVPYVAPHSYTGEDVIEIFSHGGTYVPALILENLIQAGARMARPGEFTLRAFLNDKLDLAQAESIEFIVSARTRAELDLAHHHYSGQFSRDIQRLRSELIDLLSLLELELDFAEEDVEFANRDELLQRIASLQQLLSDLVRSYDRTHLLREGIRVAIVGRPNVGKSSLLNLLLKKERAIVTDIPGTTRDIIEESLEIAGYQFVFVDTAGIREVEDRVEREGIRRSESVLKAAPVVLFLVDASSHLQTEDWEIRQRILQYTRDQEKEKILVLNKNDLPRQLSDRELERFAEGFRVMTLSCLLGEGLATLEAELASIASRRIDAEQGRQSMLVNLRQKEAAARALEALQEAERHFAERLSQEFIASDIRSAMDALGELIGEVTTEDVLGHIFANFCIGK
ncbi:MAG: tRNA uridine-5-carboxymethylaminomethyl(34) synthesis GTPase MnmE [candidate division KSB1 bacterium]|nr:tRNA uridine-5-carboxymethylaminomethyl(34) synthesis GTPase MnmE [candidate division KSB1 bacterium]